MEKYEPLPLGSSENQQSLLESQSVTQPVRDDYLRRSRLFVTWAANAALEVGRYPLLELAILEYFDEMFFEGRSAEDGEKLWASLKFFDPGLGRRGDHLFPRVLRALKGWHRLCPAMTRQPLPWLGLLAIVAYLLSQGSVEHALALILQFTLYLRPGELCELRVGQVVAPIGRGALWGFIVRPFLTEDSRPGKTGEFDESLLLDDPRLAFLAPFLLCLTQGRPATDPLFSFDVRGLTESLRTTLQALKMEHMGVELYSLRHGGASDDFLTKRRTLPEIKHRGRWRADSSVRRYTKSARALKELEKIPQGALAVAMALDLDLSLYFNRPSLVPPILV